MWHQGLTVSTSTCQEEGEFGGVGTLSCPARLCARLCSVTFRGLRSPDMIRGPAAAGERSLSSLEEAELWGAAAAPASQLHS